MKKTIKKLNLKGETIRALSNNGLRAAAGGADTTIVTGTYASSCYNNEVCNFYSHACGGGGGGGGGGGSGGSINTCFPFCETIVSQ